MFYLDLFRQLEEAGVRYLVVGGVAVNLLGAERMTMDVDLMLSLDSANLGRFLKVARELQLKPAVLPVTLEQFCDAATVDIWVREKRMLAFQLRGPATDAPSVDILVRPVVPFDQAYERRKRIVMEDVTVSVAAPQDIIALKSGTGRKVDESDIRALQRLDELKSRRRDD
jgi:predicted nucleotidyltransferase